MQKTTVEYWSKHINTNIIVTLNNDYNRNYTNYKSNLLATVGNLFSNAELTKKKHYLNLVNDLPHGMNVEWKFYLKKVIVNAKPNIQMLPGEGTNEHIYKSCSLIDPESHLNIIIAPGNQVLGVSVFPFTDRNPTNSAEIDPKLKYRNALVINSTVFLGKTTPFNRYRTFTHEIGHWCGLLHPFDNKTFTSTDVTKYGLNKLTFDKSAKYKPGEINQEHIGDMVPDTSVQLVPTHGTVYDEFKTIRRLDHNRIVSTKVRSTPYAQIFENNQFTPNFLNFMDYTDDAQMCMFTHYQMLKMIYMMTRFRSKFVKSS